MVEWYEAYADYKDEAARSRSWSPRRERVRHDEVSATGEIDFAPPVARG